MPAQIDLGLLGKYIETELEVWKTPGLELVVIQDGAVVFAGGFGVSDREKKTPVTDRTLFGHGSTAKAFTGFLAAQLVDEGLLGWDTPIREYLTSFAMNDPFLTARVTMRDLLTHRTGLPRHEFVWVANPTLSRPGLVARLAHLPLSRDLRQTFQYCNLGFVAAGHVLGEVTGSTFEAQLTKRLLEPLGMTDTVLTTSDLLKAKDRALAYVERKGEVVETPYRNIDPSTPAGGIYSSARDTARWLLLQLGNGEVDGKRIISEGAIRETRTVQIPLGGGPEAMAVNQGNEQRVDGYGLGWMVGTTYGRRAIQHGGGIDGFATNFMFFPDDGAAVAVCNNGMSPLSTIVSRYVVDLLFGQEPKDYSAEVRKQVDAMRAQARDGGGAAKAVEGTVRSHPLTDYAGEFFHPGYGTLTVRVEGDDLAFHLSEVEFERSTRRHYDTWDLTYLPFEDYPINVTFGADATGRITDAYLAIESATPPLRFKRAPREEPVSAELLDKLVGTYEIAGIQVKVFVSAQGKLRLNQMGNEVNLLPSDDLHYTVAEQPGLTVEFALGTDGQAESVVVTPGGTLTRVKE